MGLNPARAQGCLHTQSFSMECWQVGNLGFFVGAGLCVWLREGVCTGMAVDESRKWREWSWERASSPFWL